MADTRILIIDNSIDQTVYRPLQHWRPYLDGPVDVYRPPESQLPPIPLAYSHVLITGSEASITQDDDWIVEECEMIRKMAEGGVPILGSCFGHQLVVRALGGKEYVHPTPTPEFGWVGVTLGEDGCEDDPVFGGLPSRFHVFSSHLDEVEPLPDDWEVLGMSERCENALVRWRKGPIWGIQHHPEIGFDDGERLFQALLDRRPEQREQLLEGFQAAKRDDRITGTLVRAFLDLSAEED